MNCVSIFGCLKFNEKISQLRITHFAMHIVNKKQVNIGNFCAIKVK